MKGQYPSLPQMAKNLGGDILKNIKNVMEGNPLCAEKEEIEKRQAICHECEFFDKAQERCTKCGCYVAVKTHLKSSSCPAGKW